MGGINNFAQLALKVSCCCLGQVFLMKEIFNLNGEKFQMLEVKQRLTIKLLIILHCCIGIQLPLSIYNSTGWSGVEPPQLMIASSHISSSSMCTYHSLIQHFTWADENGEMGQQLTLPTFYVSQGNLVSTGTNSSQANRVSSFSAVWENASNKKNRIHLNIVGRYLDNGI